MSSETILVNSNTAKGIGLHNAAIELGHKSVYWSEDIRPAFDAFAQFQPTVFISDKDKLSRAIEKCIDNRPHLRVVLTEDIQDGADTVIHKQGTYRDHLACDVAVFGEQPTEIIAALCYPVGKVNIRLYGSFLWGEIIQYLGQINNYLFNDICASAHYILNLSTNTNINYNALNAGATLIIPETEANQTFHRYNNVVFVKEDIVANELLEIIRQEFTRGDDSGTLLQDTYKARLENATK